MRIADPVVRLEAEQQQSYALRAEGGQQPQAAESSAGQPGLQVQISEVARGAQAEGAPQVQDEGAAAVNAYRQGARRAPPVQDWALDWTAMNQVPDVEPEVAPQPRTKVATSESQAPAPEDLSLFQPAALESSEGVSSGRNVGAIYMQNAVARPTEPAQTEPAASRAVTEAALGELERVA